MPTMIFDSLEEVPENLRSSAKETEGKFELDASGVLNKNRELLEKNAKAKTTLTEYEQLKQKLGEHDLDELLETFTKSQQPDDKKKKDDSPEDIQRLQEKWQKAKEKELKPINERLSALESENRRLKLTDKVKAAALAGGINPKFVTDAMKVTDGRFDLGEGDKILVLDGDGDPTELTLEKFWTETFKEERPIYYPPTGNNGSGATNVKGKSVASEYANLSRTERLKAFRRGQVA